MNGLVLESAAGNSSVSAHAGEGTPHTVNLSGHGPVPGGRWCKHCSRGVGMQFCPSHLGLTISGK